MIPIFLAIDTVDMSEASRLLHIVGHSVDLKLGLEFFIANGPKACRDIRNVGTDENRKLFLDLKLHDIPATVGAAVKAALPIEPDYITVHIDSIESLKSAMDAANEAASFGLKQPKILGVTVLTSSIIDDNTMISKVKLAKEANIDGLVCPPTQIKMLRDLWRETFLMVPGIRSAGIDKNDQRHTATPRQAMDDGANALVIGREIRNSISPLDTICKIKELLTD